MKKILYLTIATLCVYCTACNKDLGNYEYTEINKMGFSGIDSVSEVVAGEVLRITPEIIHTSIARENNLAYEWSTLIADLGLADYEWTDREVLSNERNLDVPINLSPGSYYLYYTVTDTETGLFHREQSRLEVTSDVYEGYLVLSDVGGKPRLDMLSYKVSDESMQLYVDILKRMGSPLVLEGEPLKVYCYPYLGNPYGIYIMTSESTDRVHPENFDYQINYNLSYDFLVGVNERVVAQNMVGTPNLIPGMTWVYADGNVYNAWRSFITQMFANPINAYRGGTTFRVSPYIAGELNSFSPSVVMFNEEKQTFVKCQTNGSTSTDMYTDNPLFNYQVGMDLKYMEWNYGGSVHAILHDTANNKYYLARFTIAGVQSYWGEITADDFDQASHFAFSPQLGYLFYSVGDKLYEYDPSLNTSILMLDKQGKEITFLNFNYFFRRNIAAKRSTYGVWENWLNVGSNDPTKLSDQSGTLEMFSVPPSNGMLVKENSIDGFGKIVSISYRER